MFHPFAPPLSLSLCPLLPPFLPSLFHSASSFPSFFLFPLLIPLFPLLPSRLPLSTLILFSPSKAYYLSSQAPGSQVLPGLPLQISELIRNPGFLLLSLFQRTDALLNWPVTHREGWQAYKAFAGPCVASSASQAQSCAFKIEDHLSKDS